MAGNRGLSVGSSWCELCFQHRSSLAKKWYTPVTLFSDKVHNVLAMCFDSILDLLPAGHPWSLFDGWASKVASQVVRPMTIKTVIHRSYIDAYRSDIHQLLTYLQNFIVFTWISPPMLGTMVDPRPEIGCGKDGWTIWLIDGDIGKLSLYSHLSQCYTGLQTIAR